MTEHTPAPWKAEREFEDDTPTFIHKDGRAIADCAMGYGVEDDANAAFIVKAVNSHEALVTALEKIEYAANKASLTDSERLLDIRAMVKGALRGLVGGSSDGK